METLTNNHFTIIIVILTAIFLSGCSSTMGARSLTITLTTDSYIVDCRQGESKIDIDKSILLGVAPSTATAVLTNQTQTISGTNNKSLFEECKNLLDRSWLESIF